MVKPWVLVFFALGPWMLIECGGETQSLSAETRNPPFIEKGRLHVTPAPGGVRVVGVEGAVSPDASVSVTNLRTGQSVETNAGPDGTLDISVPGESTDEYEVTVSVAGQAERVTLTTADLPDDLSRLSCTELGNALGGVLHSVYTNADSGCTKDGDCVEAGWGVGCYVSCGSTILSVAGAEAARAEGEQRIEGLCDEIAERSCDNFAPSCPPGSYRVLRCEQNRCVGRQLDELSCQELRNTASARRLEVLRSADRVCSSNADCTIARNGVRCFADCGVTEPIARTASEAVDRAVSSIEDIFCTAVAQANCPPMAEPPCLPPLHEPSAECVDGECTLIYPD